MEIWFIRHTSVDVPRGTCYGRSDVPLRDSFEEEAEAVRNNLEGSCFDAVYCSPLTRARRLAAFCGYPEPIIEERVLEVNYGDWEMTSFIENPTPEMLQWYEDWRNTKPPGGESFREAFLRVSGFIDDLKLSGKERVAVFCHGGVLICASIYAGKVAFDDALPHAFDYGEILKITV